ncbi:hypothetical protein [Variovorax sp.]|uniref:hypothetical protein n=1 Tax=Variovorax sp. TaxID=1871043 RepID=UPI003BAC40E7
MSKTVRVIATETGYDGSKLREPGEEFDMPEDATGTWFEPVDEKKGKADDKPLTGGSKTAKTQA